MIILLALLIFAPARDDTADAKVIQQRLKTCGHSEGAVRFLWESQAGAPAKPALAYACTTNGKTTVLVYAPLPSGQYGLVCDSAPLPGVALKIDGKVLAGKTYLSVQSIVFSPDEERDVEAVFAPRWGKCTTIAVSDVRHPDDGPLLREPRAGIDFDADGFDVFETISRMNFRAETAIGPKRRAAMAMKGMRFEPAANDTFSQTGIALASVEPLTVALSADKASFPRSLVRGIRARFSGDVLRVRAGEQHLLFAPKAMRWVTGPQLFGAGMLAKSDGALADEGLAFFDPPLELEEMSLEGKAKIDSFIVFKDSDDWPLFEAHEDFGER